MSALDTIAELRQAFYRACGSVSDDDALVEQGETADDVAYLYLTRGIRAAQRFLIDVRLGHRWQKRSSAITWLGTEASDGGRYAELSSLASDFLRLNQKTSRNQARPYGGLIEADGDPWGHEITADESQTKGDFYYLKANRIWITRTATPPATVYLDYFYQHPALASGTASFDMPSDAMHLALWEAVDSARAESWFPLGEDADRKIEKALEKARMEAKSVAKQTRTPRKFRPPTRYANRW